MTRLIRPGVVLLALSLCVVERASTQQHLVRRFGAEQGLSVPPVWALAQDRDGFLWIGTEAGLFRYDGIEFRRWAPELVSGVVASLAVSPGGQLAVQTQDGKVFLVLGPSASRLPRPPRGWQSGTPTIAFDSEDRLWTLDSSGAVIYQDSRSWSAVARSRFGGERARLLKRAPDGGIYVATDRGLWLLGGPDADARKLYDSRLVDFLALPEGGLILLSVYGDVVELSHGEAHVLASTKGGEIPRGRPMSLARRSDVTWVSLDRYLVALRGGRSPEVIGPDDGLESGGALLVDREGSLWVGTFSSLLQYPEPETALWTDHYGLPSRHTRFLARSGEALWVSSWQGTALLQGSGGEVKAKPVPALFTQSRPCVDSSGVIWLSASRGVVRIRGDRVIDHLGQRAPFTSCALAPGSVLWIATDRGLLRADASRGTLRSIGGLPFGDQAPVVTVYRDARGVLWVTNGNRVCRAEERAVAARADPGWKCDSIPGARDITGLVEFRDGTLWAATRGAGVVERREDGWRRIPAAARLPSQDMLAMKPARSGGIWIAGHGALLRVRPGGPDGWEVLEAPGVRNGLPTIGGEDVLEDADGTLWVTTALGLLQIRPRARFAPDPLPPTVKVVDARVDTLPLPRGQLVELPADRDHIELHFAALTYRDPARVRYEVRLASDARWSRTRGRPSVQWAELPAGSYRAEVRASLDGVHWSPHTARFDFRVLPPWYRTSWAYALFALVICLTFWAIYRARLAFLLGLERQRTRIAMDLHDELGSGLGSIGILAALLGGGRLDEAERTPIAREVAETAEELGSALSDIVWSLDPRVATLEELAGRLASHAGRLFAGRETEFTLRAPSVWPAGPLPLPVRRNILLIGLEALHNAARHANASRVALSFVERGPLFEMRVSDDGVGMKGGSPRDNARGHGTRGMRRRARDIEASLEWWENDDGGTTVLLRFPLDGGVRRGSRALRALFQRRPPLA